MSNHKEIDMQHNDLRIIQLTLDNGSEVLIWNVGYQINSVKMRIDDKINGDIQIVNLPGKIKEIKILDDQKLTFTHESKK